MRKKKRCPCCHRLFVVRPQNPNQRYCSAPSCQLARKREWERRKLEADPDYRANRQEAQRAWRQAHPEYWRGYRLRRPAYTERNRQQQRLRNQKRRCLDMAEMIANTDASMIKKIVLPGSCEIVPLGEAEIAKKDASMLEIHVVLSPYQHVPP